MARLLVRLKLRLLLNALHASGRARVSFIVSTAWAVLLAIGTFIVLSLLRSSPAAVSQTASVFTVFAFGWLIMPLLAFGLDGTLDPATLALYPLRTRSLATGLLAASATGAWPAANVIGLLGVTVGLARGPLGLLVALIAVVLQVLFCITLARLVTTGLAGVLRSRRGRDLAIFLVIPIFALYEAFAQVVPRLAAEGKITDQTFAGIDRWLRWLPPGLAAHAIQDASAGQPGPALLRLLLLAAVIAALGWLWIRSLGKALVTVDASARSAAVRGTALPFGRFGVPGTVAARYLLYQRRDPTSIVRWCILLVIMAASSVSTIRTPSYHVGLFISAILGAGMLGAFNANSISVTGPGFGVEATALAGRRALRSYFAGRNAALAVIAAPLMCAVTAAIAAIAGHPGAVPEFLAVDLAGIGAAMAISSVFSVTLAYPAERRPGTPMPGAAAGHGGSAFAATFGSLLSVGVATIPVIVAAQLTDSAPAAIRVPVLLVLAAVYGAALARAGAVAAGAAAQARLPELVQTALRSKM